MQTARSPGLPALGYHSAPLRANKCPPFVMHGNRHSYAWVSAAHETLRDTIVRMPYDAVTMPHFNQGLIRLLLTASLSVATGTTLHAQVDKAPAAVTNVFPGRQWERRAPADVLLDEAKLDAFRDLVGGRGCLVRHGYLVYSWGAFDQPHDVASALKPLYSYLMMQALAADKLKSLDARVAEYWQDQPAVREKIDHKDQQLTFRHLGFQTACLGYREAPVRLSTTTTPQWGSSGTL